MCPQPNSKVIFFATNNINKFNEARRIFAEYKIAVGMLRVKMLEIQSESLKDIAKASVIDAYKRSNLPIIVEDAGLLVTALNGFPGPYAAYVYKTIGNAGLLKLMENIRIRKATFQSVVAYHALGLKSPICFKGEVIGEITTKERISENKAGFGFDPIFRPNGNSKTFAEMSISEKNRHSHRARALHRFAEWYKKLQ
jgi:XTP/dITP diphosphohydrolase